MQAEVGAHGAAAHYSTPYCCPEGQSLRQCLQCYAVLLPLFRIMNYEWALSEKKKAADTWLDVVVDDNPNTQEAELGGLGSQSSLVYLRTT